MIWGPPGVGKSDVVQTVANRREVPLWDVRLSLLDPTDLRGIPIPQGDRALWLPPAFLPDRAGILFLDEINAAPPLVQASAYQLILNRRIGEYVLPDGVQIVAAGNRRQDRAVTHRMPSPLRSRFQTHLSFDVDRDDWLRWAAGNGINADIQSFITNEYGTQSADSRPDWPLFDFTASDEDESFPCPRTWTFVNDIMNLPDSALRHELIGGTIGKATASGFRTYITTLRDLPSTDAVLVNGETPELARTDMRYAYILRVATKAKPEQYPNVINFANSLGAEFSVLMVKNMIERDLEGMRTAEGFIDWAESHADIML
jgi:hypothetical protein